jgi:hypothetical protein
LNGIERIVEEISKNKELKIINIYVKGVLRLLSLQKDVLRIKKILISILNDFNEEKLIIEGKKKLKKETMILNEFLNNINETLRKLEKDNNEDDHLLTFYKKLISLEIIEKRILGIINLKLILKETLKKENKTKIKQINNWMEENKLLNLIFEKDLHPELIRQAKPIIIYMEISKNGLEEKDINLIWYSTINKHEASQKIIYEFLIKLLPSLSMNTINLLFKNIEDIEINKFNSPLLIFIKEFTLIIFNIFKKNLNSNFSYGLGFFFFFTN